MTYKKRTAFDILRDLVDAREDLENSKEDPTDPNQVKMARQRQSERRLKLLWEEAGRHVRDY